MDEATGISGVKGCALIMDNKKRFEHDDRPIIRIEDVLEEVMDHHVTDAIRKSGIEIVENPEIGQKLCDLLKSCREINPIVFGISAQSGTPPPHVINTITSGVVMGMAIIIELLNEREDYIQ